MSTFPAIVDTRLRSPDTRSPDTRSPWPPCGKRISTPQAQRLMAELSPPKRAPRLTVLCNVLTGIWCARDAVSRCSLRHPSVASLTLDPRLLQGEPSVGDGTLGLSLFEHWSKTEAAARLRHRGKRLGMGGELNGKDGGCRSADCAEQKGAWPRRAAVIRRYFRLPLRVL